MAVTWPEYGTEKYVLRERGKGFKLVRSIYTDAGIATQFDHDDLDFKSRPGSWMDVQTMGTFATKDEARDFMVARQEADDAR